MENRERNQQNSLNRYLEERKMLKSCKDLEAEIDVYQKQVQQLEEKNELLQKICRK